MYNTKNIQNNNNISFIYTYTYVYIIHFLNIVFIWNIFIFLWIIYRFDLIHIALKSTMQSASKMIRNADGPRDA